MAEAEHTLDYSSRICAATAAANDQTARLRDDCASGAEAKRAAERQAVRLVLGSFQGPLAQVHRDLETGAVNTQNGFQETRHNLSQLVSYFPPSPTNQK